MFENSPEQTKKLRKIFNKTTLAPHCELAVNLVQKGYDQKEIKRLLNDDTQLGRNFYCGLTTSCLDSGRKDAPKKIFPVLGFCC